MPTEAPTQTPAPAAALLVDAREAARLLGIARSSFWSLHAAGRVPAPVKLGRRTLWRVIELSAWTQAGCPPRDRWAASQGQRHG
jgi:predicted DNA-binding transcriptional regulator AlpA